MPDETLDNPEEETSTSDEYIKAGDELPVKIDTLAIDGSQPEIGDEVTVKVKGTVARIRDDCAYVTLQTANNEPIHNPAKQPEDMGEEDMMRMAESADLSGSSPYG
jgi:hypothetical protein